VIPPATPKKNKRKEKVPKPREESPKHIDFHLSFESSGDVHSLILPLNQLKRGKGGKKVLEGKKWTSLLKHGRKQVQKWWTKCPRNFWPS
jgi:hypothetical protein